MTENRILITAPVTLAIGPIPADLVSSSQIISFGMQNFSRMLAEGGLSAHVAGEFATCTFALPDEAEAKRQTIGGKLLDDRAFRITPEGDRHSLEISNDMGRTFRSVAPFDDYDLARQFGEAWVEGRTEKAAA